jgi:oligo-1,6-glucosidase
VRFAALGDLRDVESRNFADEAIAAGADPEAVLAQLRKASRDNARTPMQWDASQNAGFSRGSPWIAVNPNYREINAAVAEADPDSVFHHYRRLVALRRSDPVVALGAYRDLLPDDERVFAFTRTHGAEALLVLCNFSGGEALAAVPHARDWAAVALSNYAGAPAVEDGGFRLRPWEAVVLRR